MIRAALIGALVLATMPAGQAIAASEQEKRAVVATYADIAHAMYDDSLITAKRMRDAIDSFLRAPDAVSLKAARSAWIAARVPYQQTEVLRFGNAVVDEWEGKVNAWPLDEGLIDYVARDSYGTQSDENAYYTANVVGRAELRIGGRLIDARKITKELLSEKLQEVGGIEANVATGYHAIEFLLWGQDLNGTGPGAGNRPASDYDTTKCTHGNCDRRRDYLLAATELLIDDLTWMTAQWAPGGAARKALVEGDPDTGLVAIFTGMGSLSYGELAGERMKLGLMLHDPEEEHDCFSDNTHASHYNDALGIRNVYLGEYIRVDGSRVSGPSPSSLAAKADRAADVDLTAKLTTTLATMQAIVDSAAKGVAYDQLIADDNAVGNRIVQNAIDALTLQTRSIERVVAALALKPIEFEGSDSLDKPESIGKGK